MLCTSHAHAWLLAQNNKIDLDLGARTPVRGAQLALAVNHRVPSPRLFPVHALCLAQEVGGVHRCRWFAKGACMVRARVPQPCNDAWLGQWKLVVSGVSTHVSWYVGNHRLQVDWHCSSASKAYWRQRRACLRCCDAHHAWGARHSGPCIEPADTAAMPSVQLPAYRLLRLAPEHQYFIILHCRHNSPHSILQFTKQQHTHTWVGNQALPRPVSIQARVGISIRTTLLLLIPCDGKHIIEKLYYSQAPNGICML